MYKDVAPEIWTAFKNANSAGGFYNSYIKGQYTCEVVDVDDVEFEAYTVEDIVPAESVPAPNPGNLAVGDRVRYIGDYYTDTNGLEGTVTLVLDSDARVYDYRVAIDGLDTNGYGRLVRADEVELVVPEVAPAEPETPAPAVLPTVGTKVRINSLFEGYRFYVGLAATVVETDEIDEDDSYDLSIVIDDEESGEEFNGRPLRVYVSEVSPVEAPQVPNPLAVDGNRSFEITVRFVIDEAVDADQAIAFLRNDIPVEAQVVFIQEIAPE
jgi:hypothetical protein